MLPEILARDKPYWDAVRKAGNGLEKVGAGDLEKLFDTIAGSQPVQVGSLAFVLVAKMKRNPVDANSVRRCLAQFNFVATNVTSEELDFVHDKCKKKAVLRKSKLFPF